MYLRIFCGRMLNYAPHRALGVHHHCQGFGLEQSDTITLTKPPRCNNITPAPFLETELNIISYVPVSTYLCCSSSHFHQDQFSGTS